MNKTKKTKKTGKRNTKRLHGVLYDDCSQKEIPANVRFINGKIMIQIEGYGDNFSYKGEGEPVIVECFDKKVSVIVWGDINKEDPTAHISLEKAKETNREEFCLT